MRSLLPQHGVGIECRADSIVAVCAKRSLGRERVVDHIEIGASVLQDAAECARQYSEFLQRNGLKAPWTVVAIPRDSFVFRELRVPSTVLSNLRSVVALQMDSLNPFAEMDTYWDCAAFESVIEKGRSGQSQADAGKITVTAGVAIARRDVLSELAGWFAERGVPISQFAASPLLLGALTAHAATQDSTAPDELATIVLYSRNHNWDLYGRAPGNLHITRSIDIVSTDSSSAGDVASQLTREVEQAIGSLRVDKSSKPRLLLGGVPGSDEPSLNILAEALNELCSVSIMPETVLAEQSARLALQPESLRAINLLPEENRHYQPPVLLLPTYALAGLVLALCVGLAVRGTIQDWRYKATLEAEISSLQPQVSKIEVYRDQAGANYNRILQIVGIRESARVPLEVLEELTQLLPDDAWLDHVQMDGATLTISGTAASASGVLQSLSAASKLDAPQFLSAISRSNNGKESFRIGARLRRDLR